MKRRSFLISWFTRTAAFLAALIGIRHVSAMGSQPATNLDTKQDTSHSSTPKIAHCVLCGQTKEQVQKLIIGVHGGVCLECVALCNEMIKDDARQV